MGEMWWVNEKCEVMAVPLNYCATLGKSLSFLTLTVRICKLEVTFYFILFFTKQRGLLCRVHEIMTFGREYDDAALSVCQLVSSHPPTWTSSLGSETIIAGCLHFS